MKSRFVSAVALSFALSQLAAPAFAQEATQANHFRSVPQQTFTSADLQRYGLSASDAAQVAAYQDQGYQVVVLTPEEAQQYSAGQFSSTQWLVIGIIALIIVVAVAAD